ncbi:MAG: VWA domain-containing protein [Planctomycetaceae bacterium]|nr:VWA domain-containing protein [Planctomycetaceae bacterium]
MPFINPALAFGACAFAIPLVIHILNRSRFRTVDWGAMHLLESIIKVNHKRFQIEQWILLLIRCLIPAVLAFTLARPVLTGAGLLEGNAPASVVILLDNSYSMDSRSEAGTRWQRAANEAAAIIHSLPRGSDISVIQTGGRPTPLFDRPVTDADAVVRRLKHLNGGFGASDFSGALEEALSTLSAMSNARRELVVISDFQPDDWTETGASAATIKERLQALEIPVDVTFIPVTSDATQNVSIDSLEFPKHAIGVGQQLPLRATITNHGLSSMENVRVTLSVDSVETEVTQITLAAAAETQVFFPIEFSTAGSHVIQIEVTADDGLRTDNRISAAVTVWDTMPVILVDGDPSSEPLAGETDFLSVALTPFAFGRVSLTDLITTRTVGASAITSDLLKTTRVVVLANVPRLDASQLEALTVWVRDGGAVLITAGSRIDVNWYNQTLFAEGTGMLPAAFGASRGESHAASDSHRTGSAIVAQRFDHPCLQFFNDATNGDLSTATVRQWYELSPAVEGLWSTETDSTAPQSQDNSEGDPQVKRPAAIVMARLDSGDPLLVERMFGEGTVVQMATAVDDDWSDLPMRPFYVPMMQQIISTMASRISPPRNIATGDPAVALFAGEQTEPGPDAQTTAAESPHFTVAVVSPDGSRHTIQTVVRGRMHMAQFTATQRPGIYTMSLPSSESIHFSAESERSESVPQLMDETEVTKLAESLSGTVVASSKVWIDRDDVRRHGREIWKSLLAALLALLFMEVVLQQRFAGVRG